MLGGTLSQALGRSSFLTDDTPPVRLGLFCTADRAPVFEVSRKEKEKEQEQDPGVAEPSGEPSETDEAEKECESPRALSPLMTPPTTPPVSHGVSTLTTSSTTDSHFQKSSAPGTQHNGVVKSPDLINTSTPDDGSRTTFDDCKTQPAHPDLLSTQDSLQFVQASPRSLYVLSEIPTSYVCPITQEPMLDPVVTPEGHFFERSVIESWLSNHPDCPLSRNALQTDMLIPLPKLKEDIRQFLRENPMCVEEPVLSVDRATSSEQVFIRDNPLTKVAPTHVFSSNTALLERDRRPGNAVVAIRSDYPLRLP